MPHCLVDTDIRYHMGVEWLVNFLFPKKCVNCGKVGSYVCEKCEVGLWEEEQICPVCTRNSRYGLVHKYCHRSWGLDGLTCLWTYEGIARKIIKKAKYKFFYDILSELTVSGSQLTVRPEFTYFERFLQEKPTVVPVPLWEGRERWRGFNQAEIIGRSFATRHKLACNSHLLLRTRDTGHQTGREREERLEAVKDAFKISNYSNLPNLPKNILLVDDVWTTGATMSECCKILKQNGGKNVWGLVLAR